MRILICGVVTATLLYGGYWIVGSRSVLSGVETALAGMKQEGVADYASVSIRGFPSRFDLTVESPVLASRDGLVRWSAPFLQLFALSYRPNHLIAVWPHEQSVGVGTQTMTLTTADMRASAVFGYRLDLPLDHATLVAKDGRLLSDFGWSVGFTEARFATRLSPLAANAHDIGFAAEGVLPGAPGLPDATTAAPAALRIDATLEFDRPIDRNANQPLITAITIREARAISGAASLTASGDLAITETGSPEGRVMLRATEWETVIAVIAATGLIRPEIAPTYVAMLDQLATQSADPEVVHIPLDFRSGRMSLGPIPLGPAPRLSGYLQ